MSLFKVKTQYISAANTLTEARTCHAPFSIGSDIYYKLKSFNVFDDFCEEVIPVIEPWKEDLDITISASKSIQDSTLDKAVLLIRMQSWADYYNKLDNFVAYWNDITTQPKFGIEITTVNSCRRATVNCWKNSNRNLFQISVGTRERADEMLKYFKDDIEKLINDKLL